MTPQRILAISVLVLAGMTWSCSVSAQDEDMERWKRSTWRINLKLDTPNLVPPAVQWAVFDKDPVPGFRKRVMRMEGYDQRQLARAEDESKNEIARFAQMAVSWDLGFRDVTGDKVYLLTSAPGVSHSLSSNSPDGKKWIVTKILRIKKKPVCWCIPVEVREGKETHITLNEENTFDLASSFDKARAQAVEAD